MMKVIIVYFFIRKQYYSLHLKFFTLNLSCLDVDIVFIRICLSSYNSSPTSFASEYFHKCYQFISSFCRCFDNIDWLVDDGLLTHLQILSYLWSYLSCSSAISNHYNLLLSDWDMSKHICFTCYFLSQLIYHNIARLFDLVY